MLESVARALRVGRLDRIDKLLSYRGAGSRKEVDALLKKGRVKVHGNVIKKRGTKLPCDTDIFVSNKILHPVPLLAIYNKPIGMVSSMKDNWERMDMSSLESEYPFLKSMHPVVCMLHFFQSIISLCYRVYVSKGRLDKDTSGLLLFSRDGPLTNSLLLPSSGAEREYRAVVDGKVCVEQLTNDLAAGIMLSFSYVYM